MTIDRHARIRKYVGILSSKAWDNLRNSQYLRPPLIDSRGMRFGRPKLLLWRDAAGFHDYEPHTLTVFQPFDDISPLARKAVWKQSDDLRPLQEFAEGKKQESLPEPLPTIEVYDKTIDGSRFDALLDEAVGLRIPVVWPWPKDRDSLTTDVGMVGFEFYDLAEPPARVRCAWSVDLPPEWQPVADWFGRMFQWLETQLDEK
jgi:hypothetical protein